MVVEMGVMGHRYCNHGYFDTSIHSVQAALSTSFTDFHRFYNRCHPCNQWFRSFFWTQVGMIFMIFIDLR